MAENHELYKEISQLKGLLIKAQNERMALNDIGKCFWYFDHFFSQELCISLPSRPFKMRDLILHLPYCWVFNTKCIFIFDIRFITTILLNSKIFSTIGMDLSFWTSTLSKKGKNLLFCQTLWAKPGVFWTAPPLVWNRKWSETIASTKLWFQTKPNWY